MTWFARQAALVSVTGALLAVLTATTAGQAATTGGRAAHTAPGHASAGRADQRLGGRHGRAAVSGHAAAVTAGQQAGVRRYWTRTRMEHAIPLKAGNAAAPGHPSRDGTAGRSWLSAPVPGSTVSGGTVSGGAVSGSTVSGSTVPSGTGGSWAAQNAGTGYAPTFPATGASPSQPGASGTSMTGAPSGTGTSVGVGGAADQSLNVPPAAPTAAAGETSTAPGAGGTVSPSVATAPPGPAPGSAAAGVPATGSPGTGAASPPVDPPAQSGSTATTTGSLWSSGGAVARTTGKVFFTLGKADYVCSGSTVASSAQDVVTTAAHCVKNGTGAWAANWTFVPGYTDGNAPYGTYSARTFYVASQWSTQEDNDDDVAFVTVNPATVHGAQVQVVSEVGGQGISFGSQPAQEVTFGYPAEPPYRGGSLYYCSGPLRADPYHETDDHGMGCVLTAGSSGGPWLASFDPVTGTGTITAVSSFKYSNNNQLLYGAPLGTTAQSLYQAAETAQAGQPS